MGLNSFRKEYALNTSLALVLVGCLSNAVGEISVPNKFVDGQPAVADEVNENFDELAEAIRSINQPQDAYTVLSQEELESGLVRTTLYAYEKSNFFNEQYFVDPSDTFEDEDYVYVAEGRGTIVNALGRFSEAFRYVMTPDEDTREPVSEIAPTLCPDDTPIARWTGDTIRYSYSLVGQDGTLAFSNYSTSEGGVFIGCQAYAQTFNSWWIEYYYLEGAGTGKFQCIERAAYFGAFNGGGQSAWDKLYVQSPTTYPRVSTGSYNGESNGEWGTYFIEIDAPSDCLVF